MRLAVSNLAWDVPDDEAVAQLLQRHGVDAIDISHAKYFPSPQQTTPARVAQVRSWWNQRGIDITGMQSLLYGTTGWNLFGPADMRQAMLQHLTAICRIGAALGATRLVFGSPKNRDRTGLTDAQALDLAVPFFRELGAAAASAGVVVCLEPNPAAYGANFMTTTQETCDVVELVDHPQILLNLDIGAITSNGENIEAVLARSTHLVGHMHLSEPGLVPIGDSAADHAAIAAALQTRHGQRILTVEMVATRNEPHLTAIDRALRVACRHYR